MVVQIDSLFQVGLTDEIQVGYLCFLVCFFFLWLQANYALIKVHSMV